MDQRIGNISVHGWVTADLLLVYGHQEQDVGNLRRYLYAYHAVNPKMVRFTVAFTVLLWFGLVWSLLDARLNSARCRTRMTLHVCSVS